MDPDWKKLMPHRPLNAGDGAYVERPEGSGRGIADLVLAGKSTVLVAGPVGVGKSTELAAAAARLGWHRVVCLVPLDRLENMRRITADQALLRIAGQLAHFAVRMLALNLSSPLRWALVSQGVLRDELATGSQASAFHGSPAALARATVEEVTRLSMQQRVVILVDGTEKTDEEPAAALFEALAALRDELDLVVVVPWSAAYGPRARDVVRQGERMVALRALPVGPPADPARGASRDGDPGLTCHRVPHPSSGARGATALPDRPLGIRRRDHVETLFSPPGMSCAVRDAEVPMASSHSIGRVLRQVLSLSLAPLVGACGSSITTEGFDAIACRGPGEPQYLPKLKPAAAADYLELLELSASLGEPPRSLESFGDRCAQATDKAACEAKVAAATSGQGFLLGECVDFCPSVILVVNSGDDVTVIDTDKELKSWLLPVDAPADAVLIATLAGYSVPCGDVTKGGVRPSGSSYEVIGSRITATCSPIETTKYLLRVDADGNVKEVDSEVIESQAGACIGRRPAGLALRRARGATRVGAYFAQVAHLEAASVHAFEALRDELVLHGAPQSLLDQARAARRDEVRHARVMRKVAEQYGGVVRAPRVERRPPRSLEAIALDNAAEGCVRETFGALVGMWQARFARDLEVRRVMQRIARDETRHASLAWAIDAWIRPRLSPIERRRMEEARQSALDGVAEEAERGYPRELVEEAGLPGARAGQRLAQHFAQAVDARAAG